MITQCFRRMTDRSYALSNYRICMDSNQFHNWKVPSDVISITDKIMRKIYPSGSGTHFRPSATPYVTCVPVKECRSFCRTVLCIAPELQLFQYHATEKQVPHASCGKMTSSSPLTRWLPLPYQKHGYCLVPFAFLSFRMSLLSLPRERVLSVMAYLRSDCF